MNKIVAFLNDESGASAAEYAIIIAVVGAALVLALGTFTTAFSGAMTKIGAIINPAP
jgi:pilus assembly protein Flp/PilA